MLETWDVDWEPSNALSMPIDDILNEKSFDVDENDMAPLMEGEEPMTNGAMLLIRVTMVELTTLVIMLDTPGGNIPPVTIVEVGVVGTPDPDTCEVSSIVAQ
jgi:hypothetical protein